MKYIDAEKLIATLERQNVDKKVIEPLIRIIDSLKQEQPNNEDVDKVAQELYEHLYELKRRNNVPTNLYDKQEIIDLWKAGIVYGRSHPKQLRPEVDLEKEIDRVFFQKDCGSDRLYHKEIAKIAHHFYDLGLKARKEFTCEG